MNDRKIGQKLVRKLYETNHSFGVMKQIIASVFLKQIIASVFLIQIIASVFFNQIIASVFFNTTS